jgi:hypothetical protein
METRKYPVSIRFDVEVTLLRMTIHIPQGETRMASSKKKTLGKPGIPPSERRSRSSLPSFGGFSFPVPAAQILDLPRFRGLWEDWHRSGVISRPWDLEVYLEITAHFVREGLIDWGGMEGMKPVVRAVLERVRTGEMTLDEVQASIDRSGWLCSG